jgi:hypothetical protein
MLESIWLVCTRCTLNKTTLFGQVDYHCIDVQHEPRLVDWQCRHLFVANMNTTSTTRCDKRNVSRYIGLGLVSSLHRSESRFCSCITAQALASQQIDGGAMIYHKLILDMYMYPKQRRLSPFHLQYLYILTTPPIDRVVGRDNLLALSFPARRHLSIY